MAFLKLKLNFIFNYATIRLLEWQKLPTVQLATVKAQIQVMSMADTALENGNNESVQTVNIGRGKDGKFVAIGEKKPRVRKRKAILEQMSVAELLAKLNSNVIDSRTLAGTQFEIVKAGLEMDARATVISLLKHDIAASSVLIRSILDYCQDNKGNLISKKGELPKALTKDLPKFQASMAKAIYVLMRLENEAGKLGGKPIEKGKAAYDMADIILGIDNEQDENETAD